jgi:adenylate cyclase
VSKLKFKFEQHVLGAILGAATAVVAGYSLLNLNVPWGKALVRASYDLPFLARPHLPVNEVVLVYMDDAAHQELKQPMNRPWDRAVHAQLLERLKADHARAVVFDIVFSDPGPDPASDAKLAAALKSFGNVVLAADYVTADFDQAGGMTLVRPIESFREAAHWGVAQLIDKPDFLVRQHYHGPREVAEEPVVSETWRAATLAGAPISKNPASRSDERWVNYYGPPGHLPAVSYSQALYPDGTPPGTFSNKVVFVGAKLKTFFSGQRKDEFRSPYTIMVKNSDTFANVFMPGVEVQATIFLNLLRGDWFTRPNGYAELAGMILFGAFAGAWLVRFKPMTATGAGLLLIALVAAGTWLAVRQNVWFPWLVLVMQVIVALIWSVLFNSVQLYVQKRLLEQSLSLYLSPKLVKKFAGRPDMLKPGAEKQKLTILFSDIAGFTSISEGVDSDELAVMMNAYFQGAVAGCIHPTDGTVVKYIGDAIFAFWNAPEPQSDHAVRACSAALRFREQSREPVNGHQLVTRIGLHTGVANVGNFGSATRIDYTAIGESINLASRMEGLNKYLGTQVLITGETRKETGDEFVMRRLGKFKLKGFERSVAVFELLGVRGEESRLSPLIDAFESALNRFQAGEFTEAQSHFERMLAAFPDDGPSKFYLRELESLAGRPTPDGWDGVVELHEK